MQLQRAQPRLQALGVATYAISGSPLAADREIARGDRLTFPLIWDPQFRIGRRYGVYGGTAMPMDRHAIFVVNTRGHIVFRAEPSNMHVPLSGILRAARHARGS